MTWSRAGAMRCIGNHDASADRGEAGDAHLAALQQVALMVQQQALTLAYNDVLLLMAGTFLRCPAADIVAGEASGGAAVEAH